MFVLNRYQTHISIWLVSRGCSLVAWFRFVFNECRFLLIQRNRRNYFATHTKRAPVTINKLLTPGFGSTIPYVGRSHWSVVNMNNRVCLTCAWQQDHFLCTDFYFVQRIFSLFILFIHGILLKNSSSGSWLRAIEDIKPFRC